VSSILSKKLAAGSTHVLIDIPVGPTAKIKTQAEARKLEQTFLIISKALKISCDVEITDGLQPIGCGIGPALEARDVIAVLQNLDTAPPDLRDKAVYLAGKVMELAGLAAKDAGKGKALACLSSGQAWESFKRICAAQGGMRDIPKARYCHTIVATHSGMVESMDNKVYRFGGSSGAGFADYSFRFACGLEKCHRGGLKKTRYQDIRPSAS